MSDSIDHAEVQKTCEAGAGSFSPGRDRIWFATLLGFGLLARLYFAGSLFLDPDEALHYWLSLQPSLAAAYHATLSTAHPPLFILFLYYWRLLGHSEILLRLPGVIAGIAFCWIIYRWIARIDGEETAGIALPLLLFTPSMIWLSAEVRQYWLLLLFVAIALYCFERAISEQSIAWMLGFTLALDVALATHYSALLFALIMGIYALIRLRSVHGTRKVLVACALGQLSALIEVGIFFKTHISLLKKSGLPQEIADTWLRKSIFHPGQDHLVSFLARNTVRFFRYLFGNGAVGAFGLIAFALGVVIVFRKASRPDGQRIGTTPKSWITGTSVLPVVAFVVAALAGLQALYPYGGTRHDVFLAPFAILGVSVGLSYWRTRFWIRNAVVVLVLLAANLFPSPAGPFIDPKDQSKSVMSDAIAALRANPTGSVLFTDYEGGLILSYYLCDRPVVQVIPPYQAFTRTPCGELTVISAAPTGSTIGQQWKFQASDFTERMREVESLYSLPSDVVVFRAGWSVDSDLELLKVFENLGCKPQHFGENVLVCKIKPSAGRITSAPQ